jgi:hypothetical protein
VKGSKYVDKLKGNYSFGYAVTVEAKIQIKSWKN